MSTHVPIINGQKRIIILSDIHANFPALQSVISFIKDDDIVICLGDMVGYYTEPNEICEYISTRADFVIAGNHDLYCLDTIPFKANNEKKYRVFETRRALKQEYKEWLSSLPLSLTLTVDVPFTIQTPLGASLIKQIILAHGAPDNIETYIYPDKVLTNNIPPHTLLLLGHTHHPMLRIESFGLSLNPGSIGQPRDWNPRPSFAIIDGKKNSITLNRTIYDWHGYAQDLENSGLETDSINLLTRQKSFD